MPARAGSSSFALYPSGVADASTAPACVLRLKVARHSCCSAPLQPSSSSPPSPASSSSSALTPPPATATSTCSCTGYRPPPGREVRQRRVKAARDADAEGPEWAWGRCSCGHAMEHHGSLASADEEEQARLGRVAVRLDELLEDQGKLLDFSYEDEDITSLRRQMTQLEPEPALEPGESIPVRSNANRKRKSRSPTVSSRLSSPDQPVTAQTSRANSRERGSPGPKRRRLEVESEVGAEAKGDDAQGATTNGQGEGHGKMPSVSQKGHPTAGDGAAPQATGASSEEKEAENNLTEATADIASVTKGVSIDVAPAGGTDEGGILAGISETPLKRERPAVIEERSGLIEFRVVANDGRPESMIVLTGLKNIFQRQLPKMPREYITRLVLDRNHVSMAIVKRGLQVVGGITYRPFHQRRFAEIVFCAITSTEQVKGYGSHLMNHLKDHVQGTSNITHFLTYADNYAIGYFKKQGFTKEISLERAVWVGYIKDYEGGTLMMCHMVPRVQYLDVGRLLASQKEAVLAKIRQYSRSHVVHPGLEVFRKPRPSNATGFVIQPNEVPGLKESGWTPEMDELSRRPKRGPHHSLMRTIIQELSGHQSAWPFAQPVNGDEVVDYYKVIEHPMDLSTMESKLDDNQYRTLDDLLHDANLIFDNCARYNGANSNYTKQANTLSRFLQRELPAWKQAAGIFEH